MSLYTLQSSGTDWRVCHLPSHRRTLWWRYRRESAIFTILFVVLCLLYGQEPSRGRRLRSIGGSEVFATICLFIHSLTILRA